MHPIAALRLFSRILVAYFVLWKSPIVTMNDGRQCSSLRKNAHESSVRSLQFRRTLFEYFVFNCTTTDINDIIGKSPVFYRLTHCETSFSVREEIPEIMDVTIRCLNIHKHFQIPKAVAIGACMLREITLVDVKPTSLPMEATTP